MLFLTGHMTFEIDRMRENREPSLLDMSKTSVKALERATEHSDKGYFMMIEAARIDHASHANDPAAALWESIEYNSVMDFLKKHVEDHEDTVLVSAADHETGGLVLAGYDPTRLQSATASAEYLSELWEGYEGDDARTFLAETLLPLSGLSGLNATEIDRVSEAEDPVDAMMQTLSDQAGIAWGTGGHSAVDVGLLAYGAPRLLADLRRALVGGHENTDIAEHVRQLLGVSTQAVTKILRGAGDVWLTEGNVEDAQELAAEQE